MNEQEARSIERQLTELLPGCLIEAYGKEEPDYQTKQFVSTWMVAVYSSTEKFGNLVCVIRDQKHRDAFLSVCSSYYNRRKDIEEDVFEEDAYQQGKAFTDQNNFTAIEGGVYGVNEHGDLYDLDTHEVFKPSEY